MGCHGNHAFKHSRNKCFLEVKLFCIPRVQNKISTNEKLSAGARLVELDAGVLCIVFEDSLA